MALRVAWRLVKARHARTAFDGEGARLHGGRWNSPGVRMVYTAESPSLAVLEVLVHLQATAPLAGYVLIEVRLPEGLVEILSRPPADWRRMPAPASTRRVGDAWAASGRSAALAVPSVVTPQERLLLLNPAHPDFSRVEIGAARAHVLDPRLGRGPRR
jgi:RES domain-containing protein